jgi:putative SOS response-associated peptidase YedK
MPVLAQQLARERWNKGEEPLKTYTFLTTAANELGAEYHVTKRQPVILAFDDFGRWLTGTREEVEALFRPYPAEMMNVAAV